MRASLHHVLYNGVTALAQDRTWKSSAELSLDSLETTPDPISINQIGLLRALGKRDLEEERGERELRFKVQSRRPEKGNGDKYECPNSTEAFNFTCSNTKM